MVFYTVVLGDMKLDHQISLQNKWGGGDWDGY